MKIQKIEIADYSLDAAEKQIILACLNNNQDATYDECSKALGITTSLLRTKIKNHQLEELLEGDRANRMMIEKLQKAGFKIVKEDTAEPLTSTGG